MRFTRFAPLFISLLLLPSAAFAQEFARDLSIDPSGVKATDYLLYGKVTRIYTTVNNHSDQDLFGVVKFYDETIEKFIGQDQPVSVLAGKTDDVFVDWDAKNIGENTVSVRIIPWDATGDDPANNKVTKVLYVDVDSDGDGLGNQQDGDDDNDGVPDREDSFPLDSAESKDTDQDGVGDNADDDDDNDNVSDVQDFFPLDSAESKDTDQDGVGDNADAFPNNPDEVGDRDGDGLGDNDDPDDENKGPIAVIETKESVVGANTLVTFNSLKSHDPDGEIVKYEWDFGKGVTYDGVVVDHTFKKTGLHEIKLKVIDDSGEYRQTTFRITVVHRWQTIAISLLAVLLLIIFALHGILTKRRLGEENKMLEKETKSIHKVALKPSVKSGGQKSLPKRKK